MSVDYAHVLEREGIDAAIWALRHHPDQNLVREFNCDIDKQMLKNWTGKDPDDNRPSAVLKELADAWECARAAGQKASWSTALIKCQTELFKQRFCGNDA